jgi:hypothetical protein
MTRKELTALFMERLCQKHWQDHERLAKEATLESAKGYAMQRSVQSAKRLVFSRAMQSNAPMVTELPDGNWKVVWG